MCPAGSSVFWLGSFSFHKAEHTSLLFTEQSWSKLALKMVYPRKTVMNFARKLDVLCHAWVGDYFCINGTLSYMTLWPWEETEVLKLTLYQTLRTV